MALATEVTIGTRSTDDGRTVSPSDGRYWLEPLSDDDTPTPVHVMVFPWALQLADVWKGMRQLDFEHDAIYENRQLRSSSSRMTLGALALRRAGYDVARLFVTTSIVDTFVARISKRRSMPMFIVDDAEWELKQKAQDFRRWLHGKMFETCVDRLQPSFIRDACARGTGVGYVDDGDNDIFVERVHRSQLLIDPYEEKQGAPAIRTIYRMRQVSRDSLITLYPEFKRQIMDAPESSADICEGRTSLLADETKMGRRDVVDFVEVWHLPDCIDEDDDDKESSGRFAACLQNVTLCYQEWREPRFPFVFLQRYESQTGFWGRGDVELLRGQQIELNRMIADISMNIMVTGKGIWMTSASAQIEPEQLSGYRPLVLALPGGAPQPQFVHPPPVGPATIELLERKISHMHDLIGVGQWSAQGKSPLGAGASGIAIDTMEDLLSDRHSVFETDFSHFRLDIAQAMLDAGGRLARRLKSDKPKRRRMMATWLDKGSIERLDWDDVALTGDQYRLQLEPVNFLPSTRAGKLAAVTELIQTGVFLPEAAAGLFDEPDIAHQNRLQLAMQKNIEKKMEQAGRVNKPMPTVEEWHDLDMYLDYCKKYFNRAQAEGAPPEVETRYRDLGDMVLLVMEQLKDPAVAPQDPMDPSLGMPGMPPGGPPMGPDPMGMPPGLPPGMPPDMGAPMPPDMGGMPPVMMPPMAA